MIEHRTFYNGQRARVLVTEDPGLVASAVLDVEVDDLGVVMYDVEELEGDVWRTSAQLGAPMFDVILRTAAATEALRLADEIEQRAR